MNSPRKPDALAVLYEIAERAGNGATSREGSAAVLGILSRRTAMGKGTIGFVTDSGSSFSPLAAKGMAGEELFERREAFLWAAIPGGGDAEACIAVDTLFGGRAHTDEERQYLATVGNLLAPLFSPLRTVERQREERRKGVPLGRLLQRHIADWMEPMETARTLKKSDLFERLIGEVEKIVIRVALEKTDYVQTDAARFLGINRNTLSRKIRCHGLKRE